LTNCADSERTPAPKLTIETPKLAPRREPVAREPGVLSDAQLASVIAQVHRRALDRENALLRGAVSMRRALDRALKRRSDRVLRRPTAPTWAPPSRASRVGPEMDGAA
jgi:hypothetical protein